LQPNKNFGDGKLITCCGVFLTAILSSSTLYIV